MKYSADRCDNKQVNFRNQKCADVQAGKREHHLRVRVFQSNDTCTARLYDALSREFAFGESHLPLHHHAFSTYAPHVRVVHLLVVDFVLHHLARLVVDRQLVR